MEVSVVDTSEGLAQLRPEWEELEQAPGTPYYVTHRFVSAWWASAEHLPGFQLHVVTVRHEGRLVGIGPFSVRPEERSGRPVRTLRWASHGDYLSLLHLDEGDTGQQVRPEKITRAIMSELTALVDSGDVSSVHLTGIPSDSAFAWHVRKDQEHHKHLAFLIENPYLDLTQGYSVPSHTKKYRNKVLREHDLVFAVFHGAEHDILDRIAEVHIAEKRHLVEQHGRTERHSLFEDPQRVEHIRRVFTDTDDATTFALVEGSDPTSGRIAAYRTVFHSAGRLLSWNSAYLPTYEPYRMGKVLQLEILEHLDAEDPTRQWAKEFDLGAGKYPWKFEWTPLYRSTYRLLIKPTPSAPAKSAPEQASAPRERTPAPPTTTAPVPTQAPNSGTTKPGPTKPGTPTTTAPSTPSRVGHGVARRVAGYLPAAVVDPVRALVRAERHRRLPVTICYVPHPDDETIFMGGAIASERQRRHILVVLTRGEASEAILGTNRKLDRPITREEFVAARNRELHAAALQLGVAARDVHQAGLADGGVQRDQVLALIRQYARRFPNASHRTMSFFDGHRDHAAAGEALREAHALGIVEDVHFHLPVPQVTDERATRLRLDRTATERKLAALAEYCVWEPSQGRYALGRRSVSELISYQRRTPHEEVHGPDLPPAATD